METKNKKPIFHVDLIEFDLKNVPHFFDFPPYPPLRSRIASGTMRGSYWYYLTQNRHYETFLVKTKNKKPIFHVDLIEFDSKNVLRFLIFSHTRYSGPGLLLGHTGGGSFWYDQGQNKQYETFLWKPRIRNLSLRLTWLSLTWKPSPFFDFLPCPLLRSRIASGAMGSLIDTI